ncbi:MAG: glycosyltransferase family 39 protein [Solirubrobacterales bacterium]
MALAAGLRFSTLRLQSFDIDESVTVALLHQGLHATLTTLPTTEKSPPLYYVLAWLWSRPFGLSEVGLRSLSALLGTLSVPIAYDAGRQLVSRRAGLITAALVATSPFLIWYSQEARAYALLGLLAASSFALFVRLTKQPSGRLLTAWAIVAALALATHYFAVFLIAPEALWLLARGRPQARVVLAVGGLAAFSAALVPLALHQAHQFHGRENFLGTPLRSRLTSVPVQFLLGPEASPGSKPPLFAVAGLVVAGGVLVLIARADRRVWRAAGLALAIGGCALLVPIALALIGADYLDPRNLTAAWLPLIVVPAAGLALTRAGLIAFGALIAVFVVAVIAVDSTPSLQRADYRQAASLIAHKPGSEAIVVTPSFNWTPLTYYLPSAPAMPDGSARVSEVVLLGWRTQALRPQAVRSLTRRGFRLIEQRSVQKLRLVVFRAARPTAIGRQALEGLGLAMKRPQVLLEVND